MSRQPNGGFIGKENITDNTNASGVYTLSDVTQKVADNEFPTARYTPSRSLRFSAARSTYFNRTPSVAGNRRTYTFSCWVKLGLLDTNYRTLLSSHAGGDDAPRSEFVFHENKLKFGLNPTGLAWLYFETAQIFRDPSSWYHIIAAVDTTQPLSNNRVKLYVNGAEVSYSSYPTINQNTETPINNTIAHGIGIYNVPSGGSQQFDGYMAEVNFVDGQALTPSAFGEYEERTGEWKAKRYAGTYGTNGFYLSFANTSSTSALGLDDATGIAGSGAGSNDWTTNNFSLAAGADYDSMVDVPGVGSAVITDTGGVVRGNYCTFNPNIGATSSGGHLITYSYGNLSTTANASPGDAPRMNSFGTMPIPSSGKWYWESTNMSNASSGISKGVLYSATSGSGVDSTVVFFTDDGTAGIGNGASGTLTGTGSSLTTSDVLGTAYDADNNIVYWYKNGVLQQTMSGITSTNTSAPWVATRSASTSASGISAIFNFGQQPFAYTVPSGFKSLCTTNLPEPVIKRPIDHFDTKLWTGNGAGLTIGNTARERDNYEISRSLRFNSADSAYLNRTPASAGNRKTWTWSAWVKRGRLDTAQYLFFAYSANNNTGFFRIEFSTTTIRVRGWDTTYLETNAVFRDPSAWYHIVLSVDTTDATANNRITLYVNGEQITSFSSATMPTQNTDLPINNNIGHTISGSVGYAASNYFDGYMAEINFVDGQALDPDAFGQFDVDGSWQAKKYTGTYGTNGYNLTFDEEQSVNTVNIDYLVIGGGSSGVASVPAHGGLAGEVVEKTNQPVIVGNSLNKYNIVVGAGGAGSSGFTGINRGSNSVFSDGASGGHFFGGRSGQGWLPGNFTGVFNSYPNRIWNGGGGAGAGGPGLDGSPSSTGNAGNGGPGLASTITGTSVTRAGGGGGGKGVDQNPGGAGGTGAAGGGNGGYRTGAGTNATANTGSGGGGSGYHSFGGSTDLVPGSGNGGSGIVIIKVPNTHTASFSGGVTSSLSTSVPGFNIYTVTATSTTTETVTFNAV